MDIALVTGADAGPGLAIARRLIGMGCRVYALATEFARNPFPHDDFITLPCNLADPAALTAAAEQVLAREGHVTFVVHAARRAPVSLFDSDVATLTERVHVGLLAPLVLARATLPWLRKEKGHFLVLCWNGDGPAPGGPVTAAIEGGLHHFTEQLFDELRDDGIRTTTIYARANTVTAPEATMSLDPQSAINPELLADAVEHLLRQRPSNVVSTLIVRPAATAETPRLPRSTELAGLGTRDIQLPPRQNFATEPEPIPTPRRQRPADAPPPGEEDFDDDDDDDIEWDQREAATANPAASVSDRPDGDSPAADHAPRVPAPRQGQHDRPREDGRRQEQGPDQGGRGGRGRGRGRGGRGRQGEYFDRGPVTYPRPPGESARPPRPATTDYPDPEQEAAKRALARDDSFRTPHSDADEGSSADDGESPPNRENDFEGSPPGESAGGERDSGRTEVYSAEPSNREQPRDDFRDERPQRDGDREPPRHSQRGNSPDGAGRSDRDREPEPAGAISAPPPHGQPQGGHGRGPRRHRGYGRRPPPNSGHRGPDMD